MSVRRRVLPLIALVALISALTGACGGSDEPKDQGSAQGNVSSFCSDLGTLNIGVIQAQALNPATIAGANNTIITSYQAVKREALSVPNVQMNQLDTAYNAYSGAVESILSLPPASQTAASLQTLKQPLSNLQTATTSTGSQTKCPPLATPVTPSQTPPGAPTSRP
jgi:hypothetical protein